MLKWPNVSRDPPLADDNSCALLAQYTSLFRLRTIRPSFLTPQEPKHTTRAFGLAINDIVRIRGESGILSSQLRPATTSIKGNLNTSCRACDTLACDGILSRNELVLIWGWRSGAIWATLSIIIAESRYHRRSLWLVASIHCRDGGGLVRCQSLRPMMLQIMLMVFAKSFICFSNPATVSE